jgi:hypothetical protein
MHAARMSAGVGAMTVPLPLVLTAPDRADVLRSVLEGIAFAVRANLEQIEGSREPVGIALGGGMTRGALFRRSLPMRSAGVRSRGRPRRPWARRPSRRPYSASTLRWMRPSMRWRQLASV